MFKGMKKRFFLAKKVNFYHDSLLGYYVKIMIYGTLGFELFQSEQSVPELRVLRELWSIGDPVSPHMTIQD